MPGLFRRIAYALRCLIAILVDGRIPEDMLRALGQLPARAAEPPMAAPAASGASGAETAAQPTDSVDRAVQLLALLQRDGRLIDFITEDIAAYSDAQIGAAAREVHQSCRQVLERYLRLEPIVGSAEGQPVSVQAGFDPAAIRMIGNVSGQPPLRGVLRHRGWRVAHVQFPPLPEGAGRQIVAPAEVEIE
jgi:hypothetical protein